MSHGLDEFPEIPFRADRAKVFFHHGVEFHQCEDGPILIVGDQLASFGQADGVNGVRYKGFDHCIGNGADDHQRQEKLISTAYFRDQEDGRQGRMDHSGQKSRHPDQGKIRFRQIGNTEVVDHTGKDIAQRTAHEKSGGEDAANASGVQGE